LEPPLSRFLSAVFSVISVISVVQERFYYRLTRLISRATVRAMIRFGAYGYFYYFATPVTGPRLESYALS